MTSSGTAPTRVAPLAGDRLRRVVAVLCFTEIVSWGVLFYAYPVLVATIAADEGWPLVDLMAAFTLAQVVAAAAGVWVGHRIDRYGPHVVMTAGSALGVLAVVALALAPGRPALLAAFVLVGLAMSATLYAPAFTAVTHWAAPRDRVRALTAVTLVAGLASTVFAPLTALLLTRLSWRDTYLVLALVLLTTVLAHGWGLRQPWQAVRDASASRRTVGSSPWRLLRDPAFGTLVVAFTIAGFCAHAVVVNTVPLLTGNGLSTQQAAVALGVGGAGQVAGRLLYGPLLSRVPVRARTVGVLGAAALTTLALALAAGSMAGACAAAFAAGTARGILTLLQATAVPDRWGTHAYGARSSVLTGSVMAASAFAPWLGALLAAELGGFTGAFVLLAVGMAVAVPLVRRVRTSPA